VEEEISFIGSHISEVDNIKFLGFSDLVEIFHEAVIYIPSEDWLLILFFHRISMSILGFWNLFDLNIYRMIEFVNRMVELDLGLNSRLLVNILNRLVCHVGISHFASDTSRYSVVHPGLQFAPDSDG
jgi:hypothetical protein